MKPQDLGLLCLAVLLAHTRTASVQAVESTLTIQPSIADTFVNSMYLHTKYPEDPHGYLWSIFAGNMYVEYDSYKLYGSSRIYIKFNITSIPKDAKILSANMCLYMYDPPKTTQEFETYRVLSDWNQHQLTWRTQPPVASTPTSTATINPKPTETWICWEITRDLKMWHSEPTKNYGMMMKIKQEMNASGQLASFYPKESTQPQELKPKLVVRVDWHEPIGSTPPTPSPRETPTHTPAYTPPPTTAQPTQTKNATQPAESKSGTTVDSTELLSVLLLAAIIGGAILALRRIPKQRGSHRQEKLNRVMMRWASKMVEVGNSL